MKIKSAGLTLAAAAATAFTPLALSTALSAPVQAYPECQQILLNGGSTSTFIQCEEAHSTAGLPKGSPNPFPQCAGLDPAATAICGDNIMRGRG
jgi:hypothetical protein